MDVRIGAYGLIVDNGQLLLTHWDEAGRTGWTLPGGGLEDFETAEQAAVREIHEETGFTAELTDLLGVDSLFLQPHDRMSPGSGAMHAFRVIYAARVVGGTLTAEVGGSTDEARWVPLEEVDSLPILSLVSVAMELWTARAARGR